MTTAERQRYAAGATSGRGRLTFLTAARHPVEVRAAASFHGGGLVTRHGRRGRRRTR